MAPAAQITATHMFSFLKKKLALQQFPLGAPPWKGALLGALAAALIILLFLGAISRTGLGLPADMFIVTIAGACAILIAGVTITLLFSLERTLPQWFLGLTAGVLIVFYVLPFALTVSFVLFGMLIGGLVSLARQQRHKKSVFRVLLALASTIFAAAIILLNREGRTPEGCPSTPEINVPVLAAPNPAHTGSFAVTTRSYGSGNDRHRLEYRENIAWQTPSVDASRLLPDTSGVFAWLRRWYWGFDLRALPLNGRVWSPEGRGPFPLVLIVHGNHFMVEYSDPGFAYLGELLASRGFIVVSVDENFLNRSWVHDYGHRESTVRGWLLLQHLRAWRRWNGSPDHPFFGKVNLEKIALIGHSRGGQAAALAAAFNRLSCHPENAAIKFDFHFGIRSLVQLAPNDPVTPSGKPLLLRDLNYLLLQGGYDSDAYFFMGTRVYNRISFSHHRAGFKAALYIHRANHSQFNTVWGNSDFMPPRAWLLNRKPILSAEDQRRIAKTYIAAFLAATLQGETQYLPMFRDPRVAREWLPADRYISQCEEASFETIADFEEDLDLATTTLKGGRIHGQRLTFWSENALTLRNKNRTPQNNSAVQFAWHHEYNRASPGQESPFYEILLPDSLPGSAPLSAESRLIFSLANAGDNNDAVDLSLELIDRDGESARLPLSHFAPIPCPLKTQLTKWPWLDYFNLARRSELVLQTFTIPLAAFTQANSAFTPQRCRRIRFVCDRSPRGQVTLDRMGWDNGPEQ